MPGLVADGQPRNIRIANQRRNSSCVLHEGARQGVLSKIKNMCYEDKIEGLLFSLVKIGLSEVDALAGFSSNAVSMAVW